MALNTTLIPVVAKDGSGLYLNRYFIQLFNRFYNDLMLEHQFDGIMIHFAEESRESLQSFAKEVSERHLNCQENSKNSNNYPVFNNNECRKDYKFSILPDKFSKHFQKLKPPEETEHHKTVDNQKWENKKQVDNQKLENKKPVENEKWENKEQVENEKLENKVQVENEKLENIKQEANQSFENIKQVEKKELLEETVFKKETIEALDNSLAAKMESSNSNDDINCPFECSFSTNSADEMYAHFCIKHMKEKKGDDRITAKRFMKGLKKIISEDCVFHCENTYGDLKGHYEKKHVDIASVTCHHCNKKFASVKNMETHLNELKLERKYSCEICGHVSKREVNLQSHINIVHNKSPLRCNLCERDFYLHVSKHHIFMRKHIAIVHEKKRPYACEICGKKMAQYNNLDDHRIKVHGQKKMPISAYRDMIKSGHYKFLIDIEV